jgi:hypothetical protein
MLFGKVREQTIATSSKTNLTLVVWNMETNKLAGFREKKIA